MRPDNAYQRMDASVVTVAAGKATRLEIIPAGGERFAIRGQIALKAAPVVRIYGVENPAAFARALFIDVLRQEGVQVDANPLATPRVELPERDGYGKLERVALYKSPPFAEVAKVTRRSATTCMPVPCRCCWRPRTANGRWPMGSDSGRNAGQAGRGCEKAIVRRRRAAARGPITSRRGKRWSSYRPWRRGDFHSRALACARHRRHQQIRSLPTARRDAVRRAGLWHDGLNNRTLLTAKGLAGYMTTSRGRRLTFALFVNNVPLPEGVPPNREGGPGNFARYCISTHLNLLRLWRCLSQVVVGLALQARCRVQKNAMVICSWATTPIWARDAHKRSRYAKVRHGTVLGQSTPIDANRAHSNTASNHFVNPRGPLIDSRSALGVNGSFWKHWQSVPWPTTAKRYLELNWAFS
jgi:hypothetical protein